MISSNTTNIKTRLANLESRLFGFMPLAGPTGPSGPSGPAGQNGVSNTIFEYKGRTPDILTVPPPPPKHIVWNNSPQISATKLYVDHITNDNVDVDFILLAVSVGSILILQDKTNSNNNQKWTITSVTPFVDYVQFGVTFISSTHTFSNNDTLAVIIQLAGIQGPSGPQGNTGPSGPTNSTASASIITLDTSDTTCFIPFVNDTPSGTAQPLKGNSSLTYNASAGNVGIGTTAPAEKLNINSGNLLMNGTFDGVLMNPGSGAGSLAITRSGNFINNVQQINAPYTDNIGSSSGGGAQISLLKDEMTFSTFPTTATAGTAITLTERMRIKSTGVGINTTNPVYKLHVEGSGTANETVGWFNNQGAFSSSIAVRQSSKTAYITNHNGLGTPNYDGQLSNAISFGVSSGASPIQFWNGNTGVGSRGTAKMTILENGNTGIGTTSPSATLDVSGTARVSGFFSYGVDGIMRGYRQSLSAGSTLDIDIGTTGGGFQGLLIVSNTRDSNALIATYTTYSVFGRGTVGSIQQIATHNGTTAGCSFTVSIPLAVGVLRVKNTDTNTATISAQYIGGTTI